MKKILTKINNKIDNNFLTNLFMSGKVLNTFNSNNEK